MNFRYKCSNGKWETGIVVQLFAQIVFQPEIPIETQSNIADFPKKIWFKMKIKWFLKWIDLHSRQDISAEYWSTDQRETSHLWNVPVPREHLENFKLNMRELNKVKHKSKHKQI